MTAILLQYDALRASCCCPKGTYLNHLSLFVCYCHLQSNKMSVASWKHLNNGGSLPQVTAGVYLFVLRHPVVKTDLTSKFKSKNSIVSTFLHKVTMK